MPPDFAVPPLADIALALALAWGAGIRVYLVLFLCGIAGRMGWMALPGELSILSHPLVLGASGLMLAVAHPVLFLALLSLAALGAILLLRWLLKGLGARRFSP